LTESRNSAASTPAAVVGAGLAGCEAAWQLSQRGVPVCLYEMRPEKMTPAHSTGNPAELVCSNSFKSENIENAHGLLKEELKVWGSLIMQCGEKARVPAGQALAVDRDEFSRRVDQALEDQPLVRLVREEVTDLKALLGRHQVVIVATGPLTSEALSESLGELTGRNYLYFHDAIAPLVLTESIDQSVAFRASRYGKGEADYLNCPLDEAGYHEFVRQILEARKIPPHSFEELRPFEGCMPIEDMAARGALTLAFGPMKPVGLTDPRTGQRPFAVVQLRQDNRQGTLFGMVGFQTKMAWGEQERIFRSIPGLEHAEFARLGSLHRNTFINAPRVLTGQLSLADNPNLFLAGQITGVEGYVESTAMGLHAARCAAARLAGVEIPLPGPDTMSGALVRYLIEADPGSFQPINSSFGLLDPAEVPSGRKQGKKERKAFYARRAMEEMGRLEKKEREFWPDVHTRQNHSMV